LNATKGGGFYGDDMIRSSARKRTNSIGSILMSERNRYGSGRGRSASVKSISSKYDRKDSLVKRDGGSVVRFNCPARSEEKEKIKIFDN